jgi:hypothetical protein
LNEGGDIRANRAIKAPFDAEKRIRESIRKFASQGKIIEDLVASRKGRELGGSAIEVYLAIDPRPPLGYEPYLKLLKELDS